MNKDICREEALKYSNKRDFQMNAIGAYATASKEGWLNDVCLHMKVVKHPKGHWTYERCQEEALKYASKKDYKENSQSSYIASIKNGWIDDICSHMIVKKPISKVYAIEFLETRTVYIGVSIDPYTRLANKIARNKNLQNSMNETGMSALDVKNAIQIIGEYPISEAGDAENEIVKAYKMLNFKVN